LVAQSATVTALAVTSGGSVVTTVKETAEVTLTATVTAGGSAAAPPGQVNFCEVKAVPLKCTDIRLLGTEQLLSGGTAVFHFFPGPGSHTYEAQFLGTHVEAASSSSGAPLVVTPFYPTATTITASGNPGNYTLTATVAGTEGTASPTGMISFQDTSNSSYVLATAPLVGNLAAPGFSLSTIPNLVIAYPIDVAVLDVNGDGRLDLVVTNGQAQPPLAVLLGNGNGTFMLAPSGSLSQSFYVGLVAADFNGDGKPDVAVVQNSQTISGISQIDILLGNGDGTFTLGQTIPFLEALSIATGDFNGDGIPDLVVTAPGATQTSNGTVTVLLGNGDGTFVVKSSFPTGAAPEATVVGDFNGDGQPDVAVANFVSDTVTILLGKGDGTLTPVTATPTTGQGPESITVADFNDDGRLDLAVANTGINYQNGAQVPGSVTILLGNGDGTFAPTSVSPGTDRLPVTVAVGDFNGDGKADLVTANAINLGTVSLLLGNGDGTFAAAMNLPAGNVPEFAGVGDFNGDGLSDIAEANGAPPVSSTIFLSQAGPQSATATVSGVSPVGTGTHLVDASYPGDGEYQPSVSGTLGLTAEPEPTTLTLTGVPSSAMFGQQVVLTATVAPDIAQGHTPSGTVTFKNGGTVLGTGTVTSGVATLNTTSLPTGTDSLTAVYSGDTNFVGSMGSAMEVVAGIVSATTLAVAPNPAGTGQTVTLTAAVAGAGATPTGAVTFYDGAAQIGQGTLDATGHATFSKAALALGAHSLTAAYAGDATYAASTSAAVVETVETPGFTIALSSPSMTLATHGAGSMTVTLASLGNFADTLVLSCANAPAYLSCSFSPNPAALTTNGTASVALSLNTNSLIASGRDNRGPARDRLPASAFSMALLLAPLWLAAGGGGHRRRGVPLRGLLLAMLSVPVLFGLTSCGGNEIYPVASTAPGVYNVSITAIGVATGLTNSGQLTLTVTAALP
jgi:hypothetical protein